MPLGEAYLRLLSAYRSRSSRSSTVVARVLLWDDRGSTSFVLTAIGLGIVIVGVLIVSNVWKTPT
jgi:hypothetical protein